MDYEEIYNKVMSWLNDWCPGCGDDALKGEIRSWDCPRCKPLRRYLIDIKIALKAAKEG